MPFFVTFVGIVTLGLGHGLILLPVILSLIGAQYNPKRLTICTRLNITDSKCNGSFPKE